MSGWADAARIDGYAHRVGILNLQIITALRAAVQASLAARGASNVVAIQCDIMPLDLVAKLRGDDGLHGALAEILGAPPKPIHADVLRIVPPRDPPAPPHKDAEYMAHDPLWIAWIPLDDCPLERGPLVVWPTASPRVLPCATGDAILFSSHTEHAALNNVSALPRLSIDFRFTK